jgi:N-acetylmuramoyl-L-alanine amidase
MSVIDAYHREHNGWRKIGYHRYIEEDGEVMLGRPDEEIGAHAGGFNEHSLGVCVSGHGDFERFNSKQLSSLVRQLATWCRTYHLLSTHCIGHRETDEHGGPAVSKTCPGVLIDMDVIRELVRARLETSG